MTDKLRRIHVQSGTGDKMGRPLNGVFEVFLDDQLIADMMARASVLKGRKTHWGPVTVKYTKARQAQAEFLVAQEKKRDPNYCAGSDAV